MLKKLRNIFFILFGFGLLLGLALFLIVYFKPKKAGLLVQTNINCSVLIDNLQVGKTPYEATFPPKEITIKLVSENPSFIPFETKIKLNSGIKTVIKREFRENEEKTSGEIISFEKEISGVASLAVVSMPDNASIILDGRSLGFTPLKIASLTAGEHQLVVSALGFQERVLNIRTYRGYKLTAVVKLARTEEPAPTPPPVGGPTPQPKEMVKILPTGTGFLRVRAEPNTASEEIGRVEPGKQYPLIEKDEETGWYKIEYEEAEAGLPAGRQGWVKGDFVETINSSD